nr:DUF6879 family protein [Actinokineospora xionganensis]
MEIPQAFAIPREQERLRAFRAGEPEPPHSDSYREWFELTRSNVASGKTMGRVRVVRRPLSEYVRFQFTWGIPNNISAGEDIRILDVTDLDLSLPDHDFWIFDEESVLRMDFDKDGALTSQGILAGADLDQYREWKRMALAHSVPFEDYVRP